MTNPLLSVCIPTYNRAYLLESALYGLAPQVKFLQGIVELVVSDNCSTDRTEQVIERAREWGPIRYYRNERNVGAKGNIDLCVDRATGEFVWVLGDDDLVREEGLRRVLRVLQDHPEVDFVWVNVSLRGTEERERFGRIVSEQDFPELFPAKCTNLTDRPVDRWEDLIDPQIDPVFLGSIMCSVFRRALWLANRDIAYNLELLSNFSAEVLYPHAVVLAQAMIGRRAWYIGYPGVIAFWGYQEWLDHVPVITLITLPQLLDIYSRMGVEPKRIEQCRRSVVKSAGKPLLLMLVKSNLPGREFFSFRTYFSRYSRYRELWIGLFLFLTVAPVRKTIRWVLGKVKHFV
jgi:glycosyltransferase involved in cell wall biosynthesis